MLASYSKFFSKNYKYVGWLILPAWVYGGTLFGFYLAVKLFELTKFLGVSFKDMDKNVLQLSLQAVSYIFAMLIVIGIPYLLFKKKKITWELLGLKKKINWKHPLIAIFALGIYWLISLFFMLIMWVVFPDINLSEKQEVGFESLTSTADYIVAFLALVVAAPIAEEILFRGFLFGVLKKTYRFWVASLITSLLFGFIHGAVNVGIDTFALSLVLCYVRYSYDSLYPAIFLHMAKNGLAYTILFIIKPF